jgi:2-C-methyl-D-erythritol 4-phosphate cytidylyltransferase
MTADDVTAILLAAGSSSRMGGEDKLWADLGGEPLIARSLRTLAGTAGVSNLVIVAPAERHRALLDLAAAVGVAVTCDIVCTEGGVRRQDSVAAGIAAAPEAAWYLVHDGARPLVSADVVARVLDAARESGAAIPAVPVADTIKRVDGEGRVEETIDRYSLRAVQTPQAFAGDVLRRAHAEVREDATDDASMVERLGLPVTVVEGNPTNIKVTAPADLEVARALLASRRVAGEV